MVRAAGVLDGEGTVQPTESGLSITSRGARRVGTDLLVALRDAGFVVTGFNVRSPTLDDVFLAITGEHVPEGAAGAGVEATDGGDPATGADGEVRA